MNVGDREILDHFIRTRKKTIELFKQVPEDWLTKKADGEEMTLAHLFLHIAHGPDWWMSFCMQDGGQRQSSGNGPFDRNSINQALNSSLERVLAFFESQDDRMNKRFELAPQKREENESWLGRNRILYLADHEVHHRAKIVLALRQWSMTDFPFMPF